MTDMSRKTPNLADTDSLNGAEEVKRRIAERAYFLAEKRDFASGHELEDWLEAETCESLDPSVGYPVSGFQS
ncbi:MAG: hypothetical protein RLZZ09_3112 [Pseudomonadota bacterium]|jgi:hypothetical protein